MTVISNQFSLFHIRDEADEQETMIYSDINSLLSNISLITKIIISMREHNIFPFYVVFLDLSCVKEVQKRLTNTSQKRQDLYNLIAV